MSRIVIKGYRLDKAGKLVPCYKHLPVNIQPQKRASKRVKVGKSAKSAATWVESLGSFRCGKKGYCTKVCCPASSQGT